MAVHQLRPAETVIVEEDWTERLHYASRLNLQSRIVNEIRAYVANRYVYLLHGEAYIYLKAPILDRGELEGIAGDLIISDFGGRTKAWRSG